MTDVITILRASEVHQETPEDQRRRELLNYMLSPEGRQKLSGLMKRRIPRLPGQRVNYSALGRSLFPVEPMPEGALPAYVRAKDADDED